MKRPSLKQLIFLVLCCDLSLISKRLISPAANILTDLIHIPGGIGTSFSLLFLVLGAMLIPFFGCAALMGLMQGVISLALGMVGRMGALSMIGYILPGIVIDCVIFIAPKIHLSYKITAFTANAMASVMAGLAANIIVLRLNGSALAIYLAIAFISGAICGCLSSTLYRYLQPVIEIKRTH